MGNCILSHASSGGQYPIGSVYFSVNNTNPSTYFGGTWVQIGSKLAVRENVFGNGKTLAITDGTNNRGLSDENVGGGYRLQTTSAYGGNLGVSCSRTSITERVNLGIPTKALLGANPEYSGLIVDTETIYSFKRTA